MRKVASIIVAAAAFAAVARAGDSPPALVAANGLTGAAVVTDADGQNAFPLPVPGAVRHVSWSPDGAMIAVTSFVGPTHEARLYVIRPDGTGLRDITPSAGSYGGGDQVPAWSPDGTRIAWTTYRGPLYVVDVETAAARKVDDVTDGGTAWWSPDGHTLALQENQDVVTVNADTGERHILAYGQVSPYLTPWSPDGTALIFQRVDGLIDHVVSMRPDGTGERILGVGLYPSWSPDGRTVLFDAFEHFSPDEIVSTVWSAAADGATPPVQLTGPFADVYAPSEDAVSAQYVPGGQLMTFVRAGADRQPGIWIANADGTCQQQLPGLDANEVAWRPGVDLSAIQCVDIHVRVALPSRVALTPTRAEVTVENHGNETARNIVVSLAGARQTIAQLDPKQSAEVALSFVPHSPGRQSWTVEVDGYSSLGAHVTSLIDADVLDCTVLGTDGSDSLTATKGSARICALGGNDVVHARNGRRDAIDCGAGRDVAYVDAIDRVTHCERVVRR